MGHLERNYAVFFTRMHAIVRLPEGSSEFLQHKLLFRFIKAQLYIDLDTLFLKNMIRCVFLSGNRAYGELRRFRCRPVDR